MTLSLSDFDFELPDDRIAQEPAKERDASRLLVLPRHAAAVDVPRVLLDRRFSEIPSLLRAGDLLVLNETAVINARLLGKRRKTGGKVEVFLLSEGESGRWDVLLRSRTPLSKGEIVDLDPGPCEVTFQESLGPGRGVVTFPAGTTALEVARRMGHVPLPPYVRRTSGSADLARYQTVYAREPGAVAAPTAGLHWTPGLLGEVAARGVQIARLVLHVGLGTFQPVREETLALHRMHEERFSIPPATLDALAAARREGRRIVACGTTTVRALESYAATGKSEGKTDIFIYPPYELRLVDAIITNFHLPKSTLLMLVSAFASRESVLAAYREAIARGYRFYSYGDAMLIA
jgi:S-adenosylmethionine:tRNA ribosyltransferase-isomerase